MGAGVSRREKNTYPWTDFHVSLDKLQNAGALQGQQVRRGVIASNRLPVGAQGVFPLLSLHRVPGVGERRFEPVLRPNRRPARVVHVQVGDYHPIHRLRRHTRFGQRFDHATGRVRPVYVPVLRGQLRRADAGFHQHGFGPRFHQQAVQAELNPVSLVGRYLPFPDRPGDHAEHRTPVEHEPPGIQRRYADFPDGPGITHSIGKFHRAPTVNRLRCDWKLSPVSSTSMRVQPLS